jgi:hypothetical protein
MKITEEESPREIKQGKAIQEQYGELILKLHETLTMWKILSSTSTADRAQEEVLHQEEEEGKEDLRTSQITTQEIHIFIVYHGRGHNTETCPETKKNIARIQQEKTMMSIASTMPNQFRPDFWQPQFMNPQQSSIPIQQLQHTQSSWQPSQ